MKKFIFPKFSLLLLFLGIQGFQISHAGTTPKAVINELHQALIQVMKKSEDQDYDSRYKTLEPVVTDSFDFETIGRVVLGRFWKKLDDQQKSEFLDVFSQLSIATYTAQFDSFSGEFFEYLSDKELKKGRILVKTQLVSDDHVVPFNYVLQPGPDRWRIIGITVDGVSDLSLKRSDYTTIMKLDGFDGLISKLQEKIEISSGNLLR